MIEVKAIRYSEEATRWKAITGVKVPNLAGVSTIAGRTIMVFRGFLTVIGI
jgi:hypothetical protein